MAACAKKTELTDDVQHLLAELGVLLQQARDALSIGAEATLQAIDKQIENKFGEKERAMGALVFHRREHGC